MITQKIRRTYRTAISFSDACTLTESSSSRFRDIVCNERCSSSNERCFSSNLQWSIVKPKKTKGMKKAYFWRHDRMDSFSASITCILFRNASFLTDETSADIQRDVQFHGLRIFRSEFNFLVGEVLFWFREPENNVRMFINLEINQNYNALSSDFDSLRDLTSALRETISLSRALVISCRASSFETFLTS